LHLHLSVSLNSTVSTTAHALNSMPQRLILLAPCRLIHFLIFTLLSFHTLATDTVLYFASVKMDDNTPIANFLNNFVGKVGQDQVAAVTKIFQDQWINTLGDCKKLTPEDLGKMDCT